MHIEMFAHNNMHLSLLQISVVFTHQLSTCDVIYHVLSYAVPFICIAALQDLNVQQLTFCLQGVLTANPPVRTAQAGTFCSHSTSPGLPVCHLFRHPSKSRLFFCSITGLSDFRSDMTSQ